MKLILIVCICGNSIVGAAQQIPSIPIPKFEPKQKPEPVEIQRFAPQIYDAIEWKYEGIIEADVLKKDEIFARVKAWACSEFKETDAIQLADRESGILIIKGKIPVSLYSDWLKDEEGAMFFDLKIQIKDSKYKFTINNITFIENTGLLGIVKNEFFAVKHTAESQPATKKDIAVVDRYKRLYELADNSINAKATSLVVAVKKPVLDDF